MYENDLKLVANLPMALKDFLPTFIKNRLNEVSSLKTYLELNDAKGISKVCHNFSGIASSYGMPGLAEMSGRLNAHFKKGELAQAKKISLQMEDYLQFMSKSIA